METFFADAEYRALASEWCRRFDVAVWAYCLMPNHVHLVMTPSNVEGLQQAVSETHRRYTRYVNFREKWRGHLWQGRFGSFVMDEPHLLAAMRYIELNPVRAGLAERPEDYPWSSARAPASRGHLAGRDDELVQVEPMLGAVGDWRQYLTLDVDEAEHAALRRHERTGRPLGSPAFIDRLETQLRRHLHKQKPGPKGPRKHN